MAKIENILTDNLGIWTSAIERRSTASRGRSRKSSLYGIRKLRALILDLAVRGKLVLQEPSDEAASELLKQIAVERDRLVKLKKIREAKPLPLRADPPFAIPPNWSWSQIAEVGILSPRNNAPDESEASFVPMPMIAAEYGIPNEHEVRNWGDIRTGYTHFAEGDVGLAKITPCFENGKSTVFRNLTGGFGSGTTELHVVRPLLLQPDYLLIFLKSPYFIETGIPKMTGTAGQKRIPTEYFAYAPFPLPPLAEQSRIIAKVDELMDFCDALETQTYDAIEAHELLVSNLLATLTRSQNSEDLAENWARIEIHFDALFTTQGSIEQLKQAILQLAMMGRLVRQHPNDEPASKLLERVRTSRDNLLSQNYPNHSEANTQRSKQAKQNLPKSLGDLPSGWIWATLMQCSLMVIDCKNKTAPYSPDGVRLIRTTNVRFGKLNDIDQKYVSDHVFEEWSKRGKPMAGDILITREAPMGEACIVPKGETLCLGQRMMLARLVPETIMPDYILLAFMAPDLMDRVQDKPIGMTVEHLRVGGIETLLIPVPPRLEQERIVAAVSTLLRIADDLKANLDRGQLHQIYLADTVSSQAVTKDQCV